MTDVDVKVEDYRITTPYWCNRFILVDGEVKSKKWWEGKFNTIIFFENDPIKWVVDNITIGNFSFKIFTTNTMTLGYPKSTDTARIKIFEHAGIEIGYGKPEWGAEPNKLYFIIKHGARLQ